MKLLVLDSSGKTASVAVVTEEALLAEYTVNNTLTHSQTLLPMVDEVLRQLGIEGNELTAIAVAKGPGSFTGLRIGAATAKGLALVWGKPIVAVSTVDALAYNVAGMPQVICPLMDARRNQVYTGLYTFTDGVFTVLRPAEAMALSDILAEVNALGREVIFLGDGAEVHRAEIAAQATVPYQFALPHMARQRAGAVGALAVQYAKEEKWCAAADFVPEYLRLSQAERERAEKESADIIVRDMTAADVAAVAALERATFSEPWSEQSLLDAVTKEEYGYLVLERAGEVLGYAGFLAVADEGEITNVAVREEHRGKGFGGKLLAALLQSGKARGLRRFFLEVRVGNASAIHLYEKSGFQIVGRRNGFYTKPTEDAYLMEWVCQNVDARNSH